MFGGTSVLEPPRGWHGGCLYIGVVSRSPCVMVYLQAVVFFSITVALFLKAIQELDTL